MKVRRVVTGQDAAGKSVFVSDTEVEPIELSIMPGTAFHRLWGSDESPALPTDGSNLRRRSISRRARAIASASSRSRLTRLPSHPTSTSARRSRS